MADSALPSDSGGKGRKAIVRALQAGLDKAVAIQYPVVRARIERLRRLQTEATPSEIITRLERDFRAAVTTAGAVTGGVAAAPAIGTSVALAMALAEAGGFLEVSVLHVLSAAEVHALPVTDIDRRRTLLLGVLLGDSGAGVVQQAAGRTGGYWGRSVVKSIPMDTIRAMNRVLGRNFITKYGTRQGIVVLGEILPFGLGALIGAGGNNLLARGIIANTRSAFGPAPESWPPTD